MIEMAVADILVRVSADVWVKKLDFSLRGGLVVVRLW